VTNVILGVLEASGYEALRYGQADRLRSRP
jgi:hypothetical protein